MSSSILKDEELLKKINQILMKSIRGLPLTTEERLLYQNHLGKKIQEVKSERKDQHTDNPPADQDEPHDDDTDPDSIPNQDQD
ncbi:MAG: hypothetical protein CVV64_05325 [Candidatus Wallbacteria bacterium HGW-Wallbacteria-1]|jgi:hypothetical protein|uniref:Uncharacterized protein n=1 Tax=Candidatus Wallbacteria bacterium HGW-Wallbacteria-1 TaxID=2013854 RepID=A0A2N1PS76_9BACT|nr:MAG: hypothetical protein CVV64_05325 [Candidatus Wallbacteria bacterium HGW-Wallbacteria-1]